MQEIHPVSKELINILNRQYAENRSPYVPHFDSYVDTFLKQALNKAGYMLIDNNPHEDRPLPAHLI